MRLSSEPVQNDFSSFTYNHHWQCPAYCNLPITVYGQPDKLTRSNREEVICAVAKRDRADEEYRACKKGLRREDIVLLKSAYNEAQGKVRDVYKKKNMYALHGESQDIGGDFSCNQQGGVLWVNCEIRPSQARELGYKLSKPLVFGGLSKDMSQNNIRDFFYAASEYILSKSLFCKQFKSEIQAFTEAQLLIDQNDFKDISKEAIAVWARNKKNAKDSWVKKVLFENSSKENKKNERLTIKKLLEEAKLSDLFNDKDVSDADWEKYFVSFIEKVLAVGSKSCNYNEEELKILQKYASEGEKIDEESEKAIAAKIQENPEAINCLKKEYARMNFFIQRGKVIQIMQKTNFYAMID